LNKIENIKRSIHTILDLLSNYLPKYELSERELITDFLAVISRFEEADHKRVSLTDQFIKYSEKVMTTKEHRETPFLWYTVSVAENAIFNLSISRYHATEFYKFLLYQLRELHQVMKKGIELSSDKYEELQAKCEKNDFKLTSDEFELLKTTYSSIESNKTESLKSKYMKRKIIDNVAISSKYKRKSEISRFYTLVGGKWWLQFNSTSFGLNRIFFHIQIAKNVELEQIIDFNDPDNTVLGVSNVYQVTNSNKEYIGTLLVPKRDIDILHDYLNRCEQKNYIKIKKFDIISRRRRSTAFTLYKPDIGWQKLPAKKRKTIIQNLHTNEAEERQEDKLIVTPQWLFTEYPYPLEMIKLYCKSPDQYSYSQLPFDKIKREKEKLFSIAEIGMLRYLITKKALEVGFTPWRLVYNYSVYDYCIKLPKIPWRTLVHFLNIIPYTEIYFSNHHIYIWARLPVEIASFVENDLKLNIIPVLRAHTTANLDFGWFEKKNLKWLRPKVLHS